MQEALSLDSRALHGVVFDRSARPRNEWKGRACQHASPNHFVPLRLIELGGSWIVGLIEAAEKAIRRD